MGRVPLATTFAPIPERGEEMHGDASRLAATAPAPSPTGWCPFAEKRVSRNFWPGHGGQRIKAVVLHIAQGNEDATIGWLTNPKSDASAHFLITKAGKVIQFVSINDSSWGNGLVYQNGQWIIPGSNRVPAGATWTGLIPDVNPNYYTLSIEHEGQYTEKWTPAMYNANLQVLQWFHDQTGIIYRLHDTLLAHSELNSANRKNCPGPNVEWERMIQDLTQLPSLARTAIAAAANKFGIPVNEKAALTRFALANGLGIPLTEEFAFSYQGDRYIGQVWSLGVVYAKDGEFDHIFVSKG